MKPKNPIALAATSAALAVLAPAGVASAQSLSGVIVHENARAHSFVLADRRGHLTEIHSRWTPGVGRKVVVNARRLLNGTWAASAGRLEGRARATRIRGTVTYAAANGRSFVVSARGVSLLVRRAPRLRFAADLASFGSSAPAVGTTVVVDTSLSGDGVTATQVTDQGENTNGIDLEGVVLAIDPTARTLTLSADDSESSSASLTVQVPASFDLTQFAVGERVELIASLNPDGTYTLEQSSGDGNAGQASSRGDQQGNDHGDQQNSAATLCRAQQSDPTFSASHNGLTFEQYYAGNSAESRDAFGRCVDAQASSTGSTPGPEAQCLAQRSDPNFPATHNGETFVQFYSTNPLEQNAGDAFGHCVDLLHQAAEAQNGGSQGGDGAQAGGPQGSGD